MTGVHDSRHHADLRSRTLESAREARDLVRAAVDADPYIATAVALGLGFLIGGGLNRRTGMLLLGAGARFAGAWLAEGISDRDAAGREETWPRGTHA